MSPTLDAIPHDLLLMLLGDARLPVAGHTQSAGLEPAVQDGLTSAEVPLYVAARLTTTVRMEAGTAVVALRHLTHGLPMEPVVAAWAARTPSAAMRRTSRAQARALQRLTGRLWPDATGVAVGSPRPVALAAAAAAVGLGPLSLAHLVGYDDVQTVAAAALKLLPLDPVVATGWVHDALPAVSAMAAAVADLTEPDEIPATSAPQTELWAELHSRTTRRLFSA
ncbi:MAG TPA: urease accessory UreF family protein [Nocardioidaceae bacterium]|nr:urease accessory UreF family protein [Nocardioidaceae bacterium]